MNRRTLYSLLALLNLACVAATAGPLGTAFTYQGRLTDGASAANGSYDLTFTLYDAATKGSRVAEPLTNAVPVSNGVFVVVLDFGTGAFPGADRWLEIGVRTNGAASDFTRLTPRQALTLTPYAAYAPSAGTADAASRVVNGGVSAPQLDTPGVPTAGQVLAYNGTTLTWTNPGAAVGAWLLGGNSGTAPGGQFLGTLDSQPLEVKVNALRALRLEPAAKSPNLLGGYEGNSIAPGVSGSVIAGGGTRRDAGGENGGPEPNVISADYGFIGAGYGNEVAGSSSAIAGGTWNSLSPQGYLSFIGAGNGNTIESWLSAIPGGGGNSIGTLSDAGFIGGGANNQIGMGTACVVIGGGLGNSIDGSPYSLIAGGRYNKLWSGSEDVTISGGQSNLVQEHAYGSTIAGGENNTVGGGGSHCAIGGGTRNYAQNGVATIGGGWGNTSSGWGATVPGGYQNTAGGQYSFAAGNRAQALHDGAFVWADSQDADFASTALNQFSVRATGGVRFETGGAG